MNIQQFALRGIDSLIAFAAASAVFAVLFLFKSPGGLSTDGYLIALSISALFFTGPFQIAMGGTRFLLRDLSTPRLSLAPAYLVGVIASVGANLLVGETTVEMVFSQEILVAAVFLSVYMAVYLGARSVTQLSSRL